MTLVNIALTLFGAIISAIFFFSCFGERKDKNTKYLFCSLAALTVSLVCEALQNICIGYPDLSVALLVFATLRDCFGYLILVFFIRYTAENFIERRKAFISVVIILDVLCLISIAASVGNAFMGYYFTVSPEGIPILTDHYGLSNVFPAFILCITILMGCVYIKKASKKSLTFIICPIFPLVAIITERFVPTLSLTYLGVLVSIIIMYTFIYVQKRDTVNEQKNALMLSQINPHFMYNTFTTIASLCDLDPKEAQKLTLEFATYLRHNIDSLKETKNIPFEQELRHIGCYLKIEKARFKDRLNIVYSIKEKDFSVPALCIQPIVENAVRHGITKKEEGGTVKISTYSTEKTYVIEIKDDGIGFDPEAPTNDGKTHIGIQNVRERLKYTCRGALTVKSVAGVGTRVIIEIPKKRGKKN